MRANDLPISLLDNKESIIWTNIICDAINKLYHSRHDFLQVGLLKVVLEFRILKSGRSDGENSPRKKRTRDRGGSRGMRQENSETVWNELARYKHDNRMLKQERWGVVIIQLLLQDGVCRGIIVPQEPGNPTKPWLEVYKEFPKLEDL